MAIQFVPGQVAVGDPSPTGPSALSGPAKDVQVKVFKLSSANFSTSRIDTLVGVLPADSTILTIHTYVKTQLAGGGITSATLRFGTTSAGTDICGDSSNAYDIAGAIRLMNNGGLNGGIMQNYAIPLGQDIKLYAGGGCAGGNPTSGEQYIIVTYVR